MKRRITALFLALALLCAILPTALFSASAASSGTCGENLTWTYNEATKTLTISGSGEMTNWGSYSSVPWYSYRSSIKSVSLPDGLTSIGWNAFLYCSRLTSVTIPDSVTSIGYSAFEDCSRLTSVTIPDSVTSIGLNAFSGCSRLTSVYFCGDAPEEFASFRSDERNNPIEGLKLWYQPGTEGWTSPFWHGYPTLSTEEGAVYEGVCEDGLHWCYDPAAATLTISGTGEMMDYNHYYMYSGYDVLGGAPWQYFGDVAQHIVVEEGVTGLGNYAFYRFDALEDISLPSTLTRIGFLSVQNTAYFNDESNWTDGVLYIGDCLIYADRELSGAYEIKDGTTVIAEYAFGGRELPPGSGAFFLACEGLSEITIPYSVEYINDHAFADCFALTDVYFPETEAEWNAIKIGTDNDCLLNATIRFGQTKHEHSYTATVTPPTCTEQGYTTHTCSSCGDSYKDTYTDALGHSYTYKVTTTPTTSASGILTETCSRCSATTTVALPKLNTTDYTYRVTKKATCTATGKGRYTWKTTTYGRFYFDVTIAKTAHSYKDTVTAPTCTAQGYTTHTCSVCGDSYKDTYTDALGHNWNNGVITTQPTEAKEGVKTFTCTRCGETMIESIPALEHTHSYTPTVTAPTCTEKGYTTYTCTCGDSYVADYVDALGHDFVDGTCSRCGAKDPNYKPIEPDKPCDGGASCPGKSFTDMPKPNNWAHAGIDFCVENGLFAGTSATTFSPDGNMTRAMLVTVLYRLEGLPAVTASNPFSDVANGQWFTNAIIWAADKGVVSGVGGGKFNPNGNITREQIATIMYRYAEYKSYDVSATADLKPFPDETDVSAWAYKALAWANAEGLVSGVGANGTSYLQPLGNATRAQVAAILMRYVKNISKT